MSSTDIQKVLEAIESQIVGKRQEIELLLTAFFGKGHVLLEDLPGMGKTSLAKALANCFELDFKRVQGSTDLLPSDILGVNIFNPKSHEFEFHQGPVFTEILLFDEMNRTPPKTQSALLQVMAEYQVTIDQSTFELKQPFFVLGTQNPSSSDGTYRLPDSQLDRFSLRLSLGYPEEEFERLILQGKLGSSKGSGVLRREQIQEIQSQIAKVQVDDKIIDYVLALVMRTRKDSRLIHGVSVRGSQEMIQMSRSKAFLEGRDYVIPEDIKSLAPYVFSHRILSYEFQDRLAQEAYIEELLDQVPVLL